jgi:hypothetical protein
VIEIVIQKKKKRFCMSLHCPLLEEKKPLAHQPHVQYIDCKDKPIESSSNLVPGREKTKLLRKEI